MNKNQSARFMPRGAVSARVASESGSGHAGHVASSAFVDSRRATRSSARHHASIIFFHWSTVLAIVVATATILCRDAVEDDHLRTLLLNIHRQAGLYVLLVLVLRLTARMAAGLDDHATGLSIWIKRAATSAHAALYATLLALTTLGWATTSAHEVRLTLFGFVPLPMIVADDPDLAERLSDYHLWAAWALFALVVAHVVAAVWHHWIRRDGVLAAMLPLVGQRRGSRK
jgi:cytochrome b561